MAPEFNWDSDPEEGDEVRTEVADDHDRDHDEDADPSPRISEIRRFRDVIYDYMPFGHAVCAVIDTKQFQRLRHIKQLGTSYYVWPGAGHNRFEHCLGVAHLAQTLVKHLQQCQPELGITDSEVECVTIAGLCHDLGHGPWSHVWDGVFIPKALPNTKWKHEDASEALFDDLVLSNGLTGLIDNHNREFIKNLIAGRSDTCPKEKQFLFDIVANKRNGLDVDKFDYIARDSRAVDNQALSFMTRLINSARVIEHQICYDIKDANQVYELCYTRFSLHKRIYNHKTAKAIEYMIVDALLSAEPHMKIAERIHDMKRFVWLTDSILTEIQASTAPELAEARSICERINRRDLYKAVDYKVFPWDHKQQCQEYFTPERIVQAAKGLKTLDTDEHKLDEDSVKALESKHVIVDLAPMHYGMGDRNPLEKVKFYSKRSPNACLSAEPGDISLLMPAVFGEVLLRVYTRDSRFFGLVQAGYRECLKKFKRNTPSSSQQNLSDNHFTTVPANYKPPSPGKGVKRTLGSQLNVNEPLKRRAISYSAAELKMRSR